MSEYINTVELSKLLGVSRETITRWNKSGKLDPKKVGNKYLYSTKAIKETFKMEFNEGKKYKDIFVSFEGIDKIIKDNFSSIYEAFKTIASEKIKGAEEFYKQV